MNYMKVLPVKEYNRQAMSRWNERIAEWKQKPIGTPMPQLMFFTFSDRNGNHRTRGYVASIGDSHHFAITKKQAVANCCKAGGIKE